MIVAMSSGRAGSLAGRTARRQAFIALARKRARAGSGSHPSFLRARTFRRSIVDIRRIIQRTRFVVVGAVATRLYMPERATIDVDILIHADDASRLRAELVAAGARKRGDLSIGGSSWVLADGTDLDVVESAEAWVRPAVDQARIGPDGAPYIDLPYLVLMKLQASRAQDLADISRMTALADRDRLEQVRAVIRTYLPEATDDLESLISLGKLELGEP